MRLLAATLLLLSALLAASTVYAHPAVAERVIDVRLSYVVVRDVIRLPPDYNTVSFALPSHLDEYLVSAYVSTSKGEVIKVTKLAHLPGFLGLDLVFYNATLPGNATQVTITMCLVSPARGLQRSLPLPLYPLLPFKLDACNVTILFPPRASNVTVYNPNATLVEEHGRFKATVTASDVDPLRLTYINAAYRVPEDPARAVCSSRKQVYLLGEGKIRVEEHLTFTGMEEQGRVYLLRLRLPPSVVSIEVSDYLGPYSFKSQVLWYEPATYAVRFTNECAELTVRPRFSVGYRENVTFKLTYEASMDNELPVLSFNDYPVVSLDLELLAPRGSTITLDPMLPLEEADGWLIARYTISYVYPPPLTSFTVSYTPSPSYLPSISPIPVVLVVVLLASIVILVRLGKRPLAALKPSIAPLREAYARKAALIARRQGLLRDLAEGKIKRREYERRLRALNAELIKVDDEVRRLKKELVRAEPSYASIINQLDQVDSELSRLEERRREIETRYRAGKLTKKDFEAALKDLASQTESLEAKLRESLSKLKA